MIGYKRNKNTLEKGFTLLEMVVVIGIFSIVLIMLAGIITRFTFLQRRSIAEQSLQSDLRTALELMNREIRTGYGSTYVNPISGSDDFMLFRNQNGRCVRYRIASNAITRAEDVLPTPLNSSCLHADYGLNAKLTKEQTVIDASTSGFLTRAATVDANQNLQTQGFIKIEITARTTNDSVPEVNLQSTVSSRQVIPF